MKAPTNAAAIVSNVGGGGGTSPGAVVAPFLTIPTTSRLIPVGNSERIVDGVGSQVAGSNPLDTTINRVPLTAKRAFSNLVAVMFFGGTGIQRGEVPPNNTDHSTNASLVRTCISLEQGSLGTSNLGRFAWDKGGATAPNDPINDMAVQISAPLAITIPKDGQYWIRAVQTWNGAVSPSSSIVPRARQAVSTRHAVTGPAAAQTGSGLGTGAYDDAWKPIILGITTDKVHTGLIRGDSVANGGVGYGDGARWQEGAPNSYQHASGAAYIEIALKRRGIPYVNLAAPSESIFNVEPSSNATSFLQNYRPGRFATRDTIEKIVGATISFWCSYANDFNAPGYGVSVVVDLFTKWVRGERAKGRTPVIIWHPSPTDWLTGTMQDLALSDAAWLAAQTPVAGATKATRDAIKAALVALCASEGFYLYDIAAKFQVVDGGEYKWAKTPDGWGGFVAPTLDTVASGRRMLHPGARLSHLIGIDLAQYLPAVGTDWTLPYGELNTLAIPTVTQTYAKLPTLTVPIRACYRLDTHKIFLDTGDDCHAVVFRDLACELPCQVGDPVAVWLDSTGNTNRVIQIDPAAQPILRLNGAHLELDFDGVNDRLESIQTNVNALGSTTTTDFSAFIIGSCDTVVNIGTMAKFGSAANRVFAFMRSAATNNFQAFRAGATTLVDTVALALNTPTFMSYTYNGGAGRWRKNNETAITLTATSGGTLGTGAQGFGHGFESTGAGGFHDGRVRFLLVTDGACTAADETAVRTFVNANFGVTLT